jgi:hypothetical protein
MFAKETSYNIVGIGTGIGLGYVLSSLGASEG